MSSSKHDPRIPDQTGLMLAFVGIIGLLILVMSIMRMHIAWHPLTEYGEHLSELKSPEHPDQMVEIGLFLHNIYTFEADKKTFDADGWVWLKFSESLQHEIKKKGVSPENLLHFVNQVDDFDFSLEPSSDGPIRLPDGRYYQKYRFSGHFYVDDLDYRKFPFQTIVLPVIIEVHSQALHRDAAPVELLVDRENSGIGAYIDISGYETKGFSVYGATDHLLTRMGNPLADQSGAISELRMEVRYQKSLNSTFLKLLLPLLTVMMVTLFSPSITATGWDVRVGIPPTSLLTLIFLQQTYQDHIPDFHYLTFLDSIYNLCYVVNLILFGLFLWGAKVFHASAAEDQRVVADYISRIDKRFQVGLTLLIFTGVLTDWLIHFGV